jgi:hypothetical protein
MSKCEWCPRLARWRMYEPFRPGYERFSCDEHRQRTERLAVLDNNGLLPALSQLVAPMPEGE